MNRRIKKKREKQIRRYKAYTIYGMKITSYRKLKICKKLIRALVNSIESRLYIPYNIKLQTKRRNRRNAVDITRRRNTQRWFKHLRSG